MTRQRGNALVEFAVMLPVLLLIMLGIMELGRYSYYSIAVANAARAGAAYGAQSDRTAVDDAGMLAAVQADATNIASAITSPAPVTTQFCTEWNSSNQTESSPAPCPTSTVDTAIIHLRKYVSVTVTAKVNPLFHYFALPSSITVTSTAISQVLQN